MAEGRPGEFELIKAYFAPLAGEPGSLGLSDDAAVLAPAPGCELVLTKDLLAANVHFFENDAPEAIAAKALRVNLSDLAAKGARARGYLLGLALPEDWTEDWLRRFCLGLTADQAAYNITLLGGDTIRSSNGLQISVTALGEVEAGQAVRRSGARPGDVLFVSGTIGDAAAGLLARLDPLLCRENGLTAQEEQHILDRYLLPRPRQCLADLLRTHATAAMDVSDGLLADSRHMAQASGAGLEIHMEKVPLSDALRALRTRAAGIFANCLNGGDDYEILATVPADVSAEFQLKAFALGCDMAAIGCVTDGPGEVSLLQDGHPVKTGEDGGFTHF